MGRDDYRTPKPYVRQAFGKYRDFDRIEQIVALKLVNCATELPIRKIRREEFDRRLKTGFKSGREGRVALKIKSNTLEVQVFTAQTAIALIAPSAPTWPAHLPG